MSRDAARLGNRKERQPLGFVGQSSLASPDSDPGIDATVAPRAHQTHRIAFAAAKREAVKKGQNAQAACWQKIWVRHPG